jgi:GNAT superfamily N-acetyltransferase
MFGSNEKLSIMIDYETVDKELSAIARNGWILIPPLEVYIRRSIIPHNRGTHIQIANVVVQEKFQRSGYFTAFLKHTEAYSLARGYSGVFVENVIGPIGPFLLRNGYHVDERQPPYPPCFWKQL